MSDYPSSAADYEQIRRGGRLYDLIAEFRAAWESDPFGDPDVAEYLRRAQAIGGNEGREEVSQALDVYLTHFAPAPKLSAAQREQRLTSFNALLESLGQRPLAF